MKLFEKFTSKFSGTKTGLNVYVSKGTGISEDGRLPLSEFPYNGFDATVGIGGDYATIEEAIWQNGKTKLRIISDVTETVAWGTHVPLIEIIGTEKWNVNMSIATTYTGSIHQIIKASNINFNISGTSSIFGNYNQWELDNCSITGNSENNILFSSISTINANNLTIDVGSGSLTILYLRNINNLTLIGGGTSSGIQVQYGHINTLTTLGLFGNNGLNDAVITLNNTVIDMVITNHTDNASIRFYSNSKLYASNPTLFNIFILNGSNVYIEFCSIKNLYVTSSHGMSVNNCTIDYILYNEIRNYKSFKNNIVNDNITDVYADNIIENCVFNSLTVNNPNVTLNNIKTINGTITAGATAEKTVIIAPRTLTTIVDDFNNAQITAPNLI